MIKKSTQAEEVPEHVSLLFDSFHGGHLKIINPKKQVLYSFNSADIKRTIKNDRKTTALKILNSQSKLISLYVLDIEAKSQTGLIHLRYIYYT